MRRPPCLGNPSAQARTASNSAPCARASLTAAASAARPPRESSTPTTTRWIAEPAAVVGPAGTVIMFLAFRSMARCLIPPVAQPVPDRYHAVHLTKRQQQAVRHRLAANRARHGDYAAGYIYGEGQPIQ